MGEICNEYHTYPDIPIGFSSFGRTPDEAEAEAVGYYNRIRKLVRKETAAYKIEMAKTAEAEREELLARLAELDGLKND